MCKMHTVQSRTVHCTSYNESCGAKTRQLHEPAQEGQRRTAAMAAMTALTAMMRMLNWKGRLCLTMLATLALSPVVLGVTDKDSITQSTYQQNLAPLQVHPVRDTGSDFCLVDYGNMTMYMDGFFLSMRQSNLPCLCYYFRSWVLSDRGSFQGAMIYSFLMALLTQGLSAVRAEVMKHMKGQKRVQKSLMVLIYIVQQTLGYLIMLTAMMYSIELLFSVVLGVAAGHRLFVRDPNIFPSSSSSTIQRRKQYRPIQDRQHQQQEEE